MVRIPTLPLATQLPVNAPWKAVEDASDWAPTNHVGDQVEFWALGTGLAQPWTLQPLGGEPEDGKSTSFPFKEINNKYPKKIN